jgi:hypothetical protein
MAGCISASPQIRAEGAEEQRSRGAEGLGRLEKCYVFLTNKSKTRIEGIKYHEVMTLRSP